MKEGRLRRRAAALMASAAAVLLLSPHAGVLAAMPDALVLPAGGVASVAVTLPLSAEVSDSAVIAGVDGRPGETLNLTAGEESGTAEVIFRLMGLPVKTMTVTVEQPRILIPGGQSLGVAVQTEGVVVVGSSDLGNTPSPARKAGIRPGDIITSVNSQPVNSAEELSAILTGGKSASVGVLRGGEALSFEVMPAVDPRDGVDKLGVWVRESTAGVGTLTYYDPATGGYGALGHAITDVDTGVLFPVGEGAVYENEVVQITRGEKGAPGELTGAFFEEEIVLGEIEKNTDFGVFGTADDHLVEGALYPDGLPAASPGEVHTGSAQLLSTVNGQTVKAYECEIEKINTHSTREARSMVVRITDPELLRATGGIVQGMSGSPIIQDGKLVGAVTHVLVNDPTRGYGIFIENMLDAAA